MRENEIWNCEKEIRELPGLDITIPDWIDSDISPSQVASIYQGGCASGAYMPAVTYHQALKTMAEEGDDVLQYIQDQTGELPKPRDDESWSGMACFYLSHAVDLWAGNAYATLENYTPDEEAA